MAEPDRALLRRNHRKAHPARGIFQSVAELEAAILDYLAKHNAQPKPFVWTKTADVILAKTARARTTLNDVKIGN
jgi:hypothetical protein